MVRIFDGDVPDMLPMLEIPLNDLNSFQSAASNWRIAGNAYSDFEVSNSLEVSEGAGILANLPAEENNQDLFTNLEHGDLELEIEFMMDKGSNSGIYFQGRYEIQILDSWGGRGTPLRRLWGYLPAVG